MTLFSRVIIIPDNDKENSIYNYGSNTKGPLPPTKWLHEAKCYWLGYLDGDKRVSDLRPYQWQPEIRQWCAIGDIDRGESIDLTDRVVIAECHVPKSWEWWLEISDKSIDVHNETQKI